MRVVQVYDGHEQVHDGRGSVPGVVWNIARETAARGHDVTVLERQWRGLPEQSEHDGVSMQRIDLTTGADEPWKRVPYELVSNPRQVARFIVDRTNFAIQAFRYLRREEFDVIHVHLPFSANVLATVAPSLRERMVYTAHMGELRLNALADTEGAEASTEVNSNEDDEIDTPGILRLFSPDVYLTRRAARTTVMNPAIQQSFVAKGAPEERLRFVPNGVDLERFNRDSSDVAAISDLYGFGDRPVVLFLGTIMPRKGVTELMKAAGRIIRDHGHSEVEFLLAGNPDLDPEYTGRVRDVIDTEAIGSNVTFTGFVDNESIPALYGRADIFVLPSLEEGFPLTPLEAMAARTPVVATEVGGIPWQFDDGQQGHLIEPGDPSALVDALVHLLENPEHREAMAEAATARAEEFAWNRIAEEFTTIYQEVAD